MEKEKQLIQDVVNGDRTAFKRLIQQYQKLVNHIVFRIVSGDMDREDICQEVFLKVYKNLSNFKGNSKLSTWIGQIAYNTGLNYVQKKKVPLIGDIVDEQTTVDSFAARMSGPDDLTVASDTASRLRAEIARLPQNYRTIVMLFHIEELTYAEIGKITGMPEGTVKSHLFRARKMLKENLLTRYQPEELCA